MATKPMTPETTTPTQTDPRSLAVLIEQRLAHNDLTGVSTRLEPVPTKHLVSTLERLGARQRAVAYRLLPKLRALEVFEATGRSLASFQGAREPGPLAGARLVRLFLNPPREVVRERIDRRFEAMMTDGALDEVEALRMRGLDPMLPVMRAHGVPGLIAHLEGRQSLAEAVARGQADTRAYAKRQVTWFRHQMAGWNELEPQTAAGEALRLVGALPAQAAA